MSSENREFVFVTEFFAPDTAGTGQRMTELATGLAERGLDITVYTAQPHQPHATATDGRWLPTETVRDGVRVRRPPFPFFQQSSVLRRGFNWVAFSAWLCLVLFVSRPDARRELIAVSHPPFVGVLLWVVHRVRGWPYTYIVHDLYPEAAVELGYLGRGGVVHRIWSWFNSHSFADARYVVALGPRMRERVVECAADRLDPESAIVIHNWETDDIEPRAKSNNGFSKNHGLVDTFTVVYSGSIAVYHDLETLVRAAVQLPSVQFLVIGEGEKKQRIVALAEDLGVRGNNVRFLPYQDRETVPYSLTAGDVSVVTVSEGFEGLNVSGKLYTSLAAGQPVLVIAQPDDDEARIVNDANAGTHVEQGDVDGVVDAIETWRAEPERMAKQGKNARAAFERHFTKEQALDEYYRYLVG